MHVPAPEAVLVHVDLRPARCVQEVPVQRAVAAPLPLQVRQAGRWRQPEEVVHHKEACMSHSPILADSCCRCGCRAHVKAPQLNEDVRTLSRPVQACEMAP